MNILEKKVEKQVQFWSLLGPFVLVLAVVTLLVKMSAHWYLPLSFLVGIPLCAKWKMKGLAAALGVLALTFAFSYTDFEINELYWHVGMGMAIALSFVIIALSFEEMHGILNKIYAESQSRLENFTRLDEQTKGKESHWSAEREQLAGQVNQLSKTLITTQEERQTYQKLVYLAKDELVLLRGQHEKLLQDLFYKKQQISQLNEKLEESEVTIQAFVNTDAEKKVEELRAILAESEAKQDSWKGIHLSLEIEIAKLKEENDSLKEQLRSSQEREKSHKESLKLKEEEQTFHQLALSEKEEHIRALKQERDHANSIKNQLEDAAQRLNQQAIVIQKELYKQKEMLVEKEKEIELLNQEKNEAYSAKENFAKDLYNAKQRISVQEGELAEIRSKWEGSESLIQTYLKKEASLNEQLMKLEDELKKIQQAPKEVITVQVKENNRKIESMYEQLKEQFKEKSKTLDDTRHELFHTQEKLQAIYKDLEEREKYLIPDNDNRWMHAFKQINAELTRTERHYEKEIDDLYKLIANLLKQIN